MVAIFAIQLHIGALKHCSNVMQPSVSASSTHLRLCWGCAKLGVCHGCACKHMGSFNVVNSCVQQNHQLYIAAQDAAS